MVSAQPGDGRSSRMLSIMRRRSQANASHCIEMPVHPPPTAAGKGRWGIFSGGPGRWSAAVLKGGECVAPDPPFHGAALAGPSTDISSKTSYAALPGTKTAGKTRGTRADPMSLTALCASIRSVRPIAHYSRCASSKVRQGLRPQATFVHSFHFDSLETIKLHVVSCRPE